MPGRVPNRSQPTGIHSVDSPGDHCPAPIGEGSGKTTSSGPIRAGPDGPPAAGAAGVLSPPRAGGGHRQRARAAGAGVEAPEPWAPGARDGDQSRALGGAPSPARRGERRSDPGRGGAEGSGRVGLPRRGHRRAGRADHCPDVGARSGDRPGAGVARLAAGPAGCATPELAPDGRVAPRGPPPGGGEGPSLSDVPGGSPMKVAEALAAIETFDLRHQALLGEQEVAELAGRVKSHEKAIYDGSVRHPADLQRRQHELETLRVKIQGLEETELSQMEAQEQTSAELVEVRAQLIEREQEVERLRAADRANAPKLAAEILAGEEERRQLAESLAPSQLRTYERTVARRRPAVAKVVNGTCSGCRLPLPSRLLQEARQDQLVTCENCERILLL